MKLASGLALALAFSAGAAGLVAAPARAADAAAPVAAAASDAANEADEPSVRRTVIEDGRTRIDELRVRGQLQRITVDPKGRAPSYEIIVGDGSRDLSEGANTSRGAAGKRVWNVFRF